VRTELPASLRRWLSLTALPLLLWFVCAEA